LMLVIYYCATRAKRFPGVYPRALQPDARCAVLQTTTYLDSSAPDDSL